MPNVAIFFRLWWRQSSSYAWFTSYLQRQRLMGLTRAFTSFGSASLSMVPLAMLFSNVPPRGLVGHLLTVLATVCGLSGALLFAVRWPTRMQAIVFALVANAGIAASSLAQTNSDAAIHACTGFAVLAGYIAVVHAAPLMVYNFWTAMAVAAVATVHLSKSVGVVAAGCAFVVVVLANLAAPFGVQIVVATLGSDVAKGDYDPLTGLLTRAATYRNAKRVSHTREDSRGGLFVAMVDLDHFKQLNDQHGHSTGDKALAAVGDALRACVSPRALLGRVGGEEFLVIEHFSDHEPFLLAQSICDAIATVPYPITASVGTATISLAGQHGRDSERSIADLVAAADSAMYQAKRNGGNQTCSHTTSPAGTSMAEDSDSR